MFLMSENEKKYNISAFDHIENCIFHYLAFLINNGRPYNYVMCCYGLSIKRAILNNKLEVSLFLRIHNHLNLNDYSWNVRIMRSAAAERILNLSDQFQILFPRFLSAIVKYFPRNCTIFATIQFICKSHGLLDKS